jgi:hypothetical protein
MPATYSVTEPHPTASKYIHSGRGGAGNTFKAPKTSKGSSARGPASLISTTPKPDSKFSSGRGGAGNIHNSSEKAIFSFDEELERQCTREKAMKQEGAIWHVGRGGAGNWTTARPSSSHRKDSSSSGDSDASARSGFFGRLSHTFERR